MKGDTFSLGEEQATASLPSPLTSFVGRTRELRQLQQLLAEQRIITLVGPGGVGKSRLAVEVARRTVGSFPDGTWLVDLSSLNDSALVPQTLATVLGVPEGPLKPLVEALSSMLRQSACLIVLDNCEHLIDACAQLVGRIARACPEVRFLATSQEPLRITGEALFSLTPLAVPTPTEWDPRRIRLTESARLFAERARAVQFDFELSDEAVSQVAEICRQLNGIPLALELASARLRTMSLADIVSGLEHRFQLLTSGDRTAPARHQSLRAMVEWSTGLLDATQQCVLRRLSVFSGGWTRQAASFVCSDDRVRAEAVTQALDELVDRSLVVLDDWHGQTRYRFMETIRAFGLERLHEAGEDLEVRRRHQEWYLDMLERSWDDHLADELGWLSRLDIELDNVRAALEFCQVEPSTAERAAYAAYGFFQYADSRGCVPEMVHRLQALRSLLPAGSRSRGWLLSGALLCHGLGAQWRIEEAMPIFAELLQHEAEVEDPWARGWVRAIHIMWLTMQRDPQGAALAQDALDQELYRSSPHGTSYWLWLQGDAYLAQNAFEEALEVLQIAARELPWQRIRVFPLRDLGIIAFRQGDLESAQRYLRASLKAVAPFHDLRNLAVCLEQLACLASALAQHARCATLLGASSALFDRISTVTMPTWELGREEAEHRSKAALGEEEFLRLWTVGRTMPVDRVVRFALDDADQTESEPASRAWSRLTPRERETALQVAQGLTNREIAEAHVVSVKTVESHISGALAKLGLRSRAQLVAWIARQLEIPDRRS